MGQASPLSGVTRGDQGVLISGPAREHQEPSCGDTRGGVMNWRRKSPSHRARAEQGLEGTVRLDGWVSGMWLLGRTAWSEALEVPVLPGLW